MSPSIEFKGCKTYGDEIKALVNYYTGREIGSFTLERASEEINSNNAKINEFKASLLGQNQKKNEESIHKEVKQENGNL
jgi:DNA-binding PadR family transcriptional regulator